MVRNSGPYGRPRSHRRALPSAPVATRDRPSPLKASEATGPPSAGKVPTRRPVSGSQIRTTPSRPAVARRVPSGL